MADVSLLGRGWGEDLFQARYRSAVAVEQAVVEANIRFLGDPVAEKLYFLLAIDEGGLLAVLHFPAFPGWVLFYDSRLSSNSINFFSPISMLRPWRENSAVTGL